MKKILIAIGTLLVCGTIFAGGVGYVDTQKVIEKYPETKKTQAFLEDKKADLQKVLDDEKKKMEARQDELEKKGNKITDKDKKDFEKAKEEFKDKFEAMQKNLDQLQYTMYDKLKSDINVAIKDVGNSKKLDVVLDKAVVYYGGTDVTDDVVKFLTGVQKIDLNKK